MVSDALAVVRAGRIGELVVPDAASGLVLVVDARAPRRVAARERQVVEVLQDHHLGTFRSLAFNGDSGAMQAAGKGTGGARATKGPVERIDEMLDWVAARSDLAALRVGILATGAAAAAALRVAARRPGRVAALVARGGKIEVTDPALPLVQSATLLIVGGNDAALLESNRAVLTHLTCHRRLEVVPGASRGFKEAGALDTVAHLACAWFEARLINSRNG